MDVPQFNQTAVAEGSQCGTGCSTSCRFSWNGVGRQVCSAGNRAEGSPANAVAIQLEDGVSVRLKSCVSVRNWSFLCPVVRT